MKFVKTMKYIKHLIPMAAIASATLLPAACNKTHHAPEQPHHNTTYVWGDDYWDEVWPADKVAASADSILVDYVILHNNGTSFAGMQTSTLLEGLNKIITAAKPENRYKIRGSGTLNELSVIKKENVQDSITLSQMGFLFGRVRYGQFER